MKKKLISLLLVGVMLCSNATVASANDSHYYEAQTSTKVSGATALEAFDNGTGVIIDVRAVERQEDYRIAGSISLPLFTVDENNANTPTDLQDGEPDDLENAFNAYVEDTANYEELSSKNIYILCNSGATGAKNAITLFVAAGYDINHIFTIENGAKDINILDRAIGDDWSNEGKTLDVNRVSGSDTVKAVSNENVIILDVRAAEICEMNGHLEGSVSQPLFYYNSETGNTCVTVTDSNDALVSAFTEFATTNKEAYSGKDIYILCNGGQKGARAALKLLLNAGYNFDNLYVVTDGAGDSDVKAALIYDYNFVTGAEALADENGVIIDVRAAERQDNYWINGSIFLPLFTVDENNSNVPTNLNDDLSAAFTSYVTENKADLETKNIYILCNSGATGAKNATKLLMAAGYSLDNIATITNGAKSLDILQAAIGDSWDSEGVTVNPLRKTGEEAVAAIGDENVIILDVRATAVREMNGYLEGSVAQPLFNYVDGKNVVTTLYDDLAADFTKFVTDNKSAWAGKDIYIFCNGGQSGARSALKLMLNAGYNFENLYTITGGASDETVKAAFINASTPSDTPTDNTTTNGTTTTTDTVKTGDSAPIMTYVLMMGVAVLAVVSTGKKKFAK